MRLMRFRSIALATKRFGTASPIEEWCGFSGGATYSAHPKLLCGRVARSWEILAEFKLNLKQLSVCGPWRDAHLVLGDLRGFSFWHENHAFFCVELLRAGRFFSFNNIPDNPLFWLGELV
jgi:hypothetical protein